MHITLETEYLGLKLKHPLAVSACPLTGKLETLKRLEDAGAAIVVLPSLFEEQLEHEAREIARLQEYQSDTFAEALNYFPEMEDYNTGPDGYLELIHAAKANLDIPVVASLNGTTSGGWLHYARLMEMAGADALELNINFLATDINQDSASIEKRYFEIVSAVRQEIAIPLSVKVCPYFSSFANMASRICDSGANGLVLFNRFLQPDIDLEIMQAAPQITLSRREDCRLAMHWIAILHDRISTSFAANGGIHQAEDALKLLLVGADAIMMTSVLLERGPEYLAVMLKELEHWMAEHDYASVEQMKGSMNLRNCPDPAAFERVNYMKALMSYTGRYVE